jgi:hypothetical protein
LHKVGSDGLVDEDIDAMVDGPFFEVLNHTGKRLLADEVNSHKVRVGLFDEVGLRDVLDP